MGSRMAVSLLTALELPWLAVSSLHAYEELAVRLATDRSLYRETRDKVARGRYDGDGGCRLSIPRASHATV